MRGKSCSFMGLCRGQGLGYVAFTVPDGCVGRAGARTRTGHEVPCALYELPRYASVGRRGGSVDGEKDVRTLVVTVPLLAVDLDVVLVDASSHEQLASARFSPVLSKAQSRALTLADPGLACAMRGVERRLAAGRALVELTEIWPGGEGRNVWRDRAQLPTDDVAAAIEVDVLDGGGMPLSVDHTVMEDHVAPRADDPALPVRTVTLSLVVPEAVDHLCIRVGLLSHDGRVACCEGFAAGYPGIVADMVGRSRWLASGGASADGYERWSEARRATPEQLAAQGAAAKALSDAKAPLLSVVVPVFRTPEAFLRECVGSVLAQSWPRWELVLVNVSGACEEVDRVLADLADPRVRVLEVENRSIAENTNVGIAAATGDYVGFLDHDDVLEPDALWRYAREIMDDPALDLLYCDEDRLRDGRLACPAFKAEPSFTKLYAHNYVTHFLMVSRRVLACTERSGADVAGAQDFDLTLKAFEVAEHIAHVPRVLYHWREHEGSTAGGSDQKPYAHAAGKLALERHLARRGLAAKVCDGPLSCTYRVCFSLPEPAPKVSIIIPSRDHAELLDACVSSILEKTTYPDYEVVIVENNSREESTFELYRRFEVRDARVRVVCWDPSCLSASTPQESGFNYAAIVNYGARESTGALLVFLNNDTDVIEPAWLEEMAGCLMRPEVGIVGAKLLFQDGLVQHAGMVANACGDFAHVNRNLAADELGYAYSAGMPQDYSMVTGACQMTRKSLFDELGGYDEQLAVGFNDGDFCLMAREAGYAVVFWPMALLHHKEFSTRGRESDDVRLAARLLREKSYITGKHPRFFAANDPAVNPNLDQMNDWWHLGEVG